MGAGTSSRPNIFIFSEYIFKIDQHHRQSAYDPVADDHRPKFFANSVNKPYQCADEYDQDGCHTEVAGTPGFPYPVNLWHERDAAQRRSDMTYYVKPVHVRLIFPFVR